MEATDQRPSIAIDDTESRIINTSSKNEGKHGREAAKDIVFGSVSHNVEISAVLMVAR
jgi:hypothetical protein